MGGMRVSWRGMLFSVLFVSLSTIAACGGGNGGGSDTTNFAGTVALNSGQTGTLNLTVNTVVASNSHFSFIREAKAQTSTVPANGNCILAPFNGTPGQTIPLSGTYNPTNGAVNVSSGDGNFNFTGTGNTSNGGMTGTIQNSSGVQTGNFSAVISNPGNTATAYCGTYSSPSDADVGVFNVQIDANNNLTGSASSTSNPNSSGPTFTGTVNSGGAFTACTAPGTGGNVGSQPICGTIQGSDVLGFFQSGSGGGTGCFVGNTSLCSSGTSTPPTCGAPTCNFGTCP